MLHLTLILFWTSCYDLWFQLGWILGSTCVRFWRQPGNHKLELGSSGPETKQFSMDFETILGSILGTREVIFRLFSYRSGLPLQVVFEPPGAEARRPVRDSKNDEKRCLWRACKDCTNLIFACFLLDALPKLAPGPLLEALDGFWIHVGTLWTSIWGSAGNFCSSDVFTRWFHLDLCWNLGACRESQGSNTLRWRLMPGLRLMSFAVNTEGFAAEG